MSIPEICPFCNDADITERRFIKKNAVAYKCGSHMTHEEDAGSPNATVSQTYNKCTQKSSVENPDDWTDFYANERYEKAAWEAHLEMMGDRFQWLHDMGEVYKVLVDDLSKNQPLEYEVLLLIQTCIRSRRELITAFRALARGHSADCRLKTRLALEYALFGARAVEKPELAEIWLDAGNSDKDWERYRDKFKIYYLLENKDKKAWTRLAELTSQLERIALDYSHLSKFTHATVLASGLEAVGAKITLKSSFVERFTEPEFLGFFTELIDMHLDIIDLIVKLAKFLKIEVDPGIIEFVKILENDVIALFNQVQEHV
ncbi:hypothetical protein BH10CYA1_BH10CYA1_59760 [soil metagenome]